MPTANTTSSAKNKFLALLADALRREVFVKLTLGRVAGADKTLQNVFIRAVALRKGTRLSFVFRHATRDLTRNFSYEEGLARIDEMLGGEFRSAHLFTTEQSAQLEFHDSQEPRLSFGKAAHAASVSLRHDRVKERAISLEGAPWLHALGVTTADGRVARGMEAKFRQIHKFIELLQPLLIETGLTPAGTPRPSPLSPPDSGARPARNEDPPDAAAALGLVDMGCGKGYLTFAAFECLRRSGWNELDARGIEARPELVELCNRVARESGFDRLRFEAGDIAGASLERVDLLVALHACDTATDDAIAKGIHAGASLILVSPCCHKELRPQLRPPAVLAGTLKHGILCERQAEFVTDALRAALLEWAGYETRVFEFISTEHTSKNLMIAGVKRREPFDRASRQAEVQALAAFYGIKTLRLAAHLGCALSN